jgi:hypothetical protein
MDAFLAGFGLGFLVGGLAFARRRVGPRMLAGVEAASGVGLLGFAGLLGYRTLRA